MKIAEIFKLVSQVAPKISLVIFVLGPYLAVSGFSPGSMLWDLIPGRVWGTISVVRDQPWASHMQDKLLTVLSLQFPKFNL